METIKIGGAWIGDIDPESGYPNISIGLNDGSKIYLNPLKPEWRKTEKMPHYNAKMEATHARELGLEYNPEGKSAYAPKQTPPSGGLGF